ncbi:MAG: 23S rRNA (guanosine2251-2'-O)-methyltransferase [Rickettsiales bacterium]|jgi:23S rRNA (guanosine2251-2'-O)-methyltransferase
MWIYGKNVIFNCILNGRKVHKILLTQKNHLELEGFLQKNKIKFSKNLIEICDKKRIDKEFTEDVSHQSIIAKIDQISLLNENEFLVKNFNQKPHILILDQITDPQNIGAIIRSAFAFNFEYVFVDKRHFPVKSHAIFKSSTGYIDNIKLHSYGNLNNLLENLKKIDYWCVGLDGSASKDISEVKNLENIALILGSEGSGIRSLVKKNCDLLVKIQMSPKAESLNVSNAAAIIMNQIFSS